jgi:hypothetical protein
MTHFDCDQGDEFMASELNEVHGSLDPFTHRHEFETAFNHSMASYPCVQVEDIVDRLPECDKNSREPVPLTDVHCMTMEREAEMAINDYAKQRRAYPSDFPQISWPGKGSDCVWDCGSALSGNRQPVHIGLSYGDVAVLKSALDSKYQECLNQVKEGKFVFIPAEPVQGNYQERSGGVTTQEVCRPNQGKRPKYEYRCVNLFPPILRTGLCEERFVLVEGFYEDGIDDYVQSIFADFSKSKMAPDGKYE